MAAATHLGIQALALFATTPEYVFSRNPKGTAVFDSAFVELGEGGQAKARRATPPQVAVTAANYEVEKTVKALKDFGTTKAANFKRHREAIEAWQERRKTDPKAKWPIKADDDHMFGSGCEIAVRRSLNMLNSLGRADTLADFMPVPGFGDPRGEADAREALEARRANAARYQQIVTEVASRCLQDPETAGMRLYLHPAVEVLQEEHLQAQEVEREKLSETFGDRSKMNFWRAEKYERRTRAREKDLRAVRGLLEVLLSRGADADGTPYDDGHPDVQKLLQKYYATEAELAAARKMAEYYNSAMFKPVPPEVVAVWERGSLLRPPPPTGDPVRDEQLRREHAEAVKRNRAYAQMIAAGRLPPELQEEFAAASRKRQSREAREARKAEREETAAIVREESEGNEADLFDELLQGGIEKWAEFAPTGGRENAPIQAREESEIVRPELDLQLDDGGVFGLEFDAPPGEE